MKVFVVGGGIGGLTTALCLDAAGIECEVFEQARGIHELGVGINILPHAIKELVDLGLLDALDRVAIRTHELIYVNRFGQEIWREPRGVAAGYDVPQFSVHRGRLQGVLHDAAVARIGADNIHTAHQLRDFTQDESGVTATFLRRDGSDATVTKRADALIGADGIHSTVRQTFYPDEGPPAWNGAMLWRGAVAYPPFLTGRSMIISGSGRLKLVLYPISNQTDSPETNLLNWAVVVKIGDGSTPPPRREDWNRPGRRDELMPHLEGAFRLSELDPIELVNATERFYEYPMCDREPLPRWSFGRVTLLGDAAHPMYPMGSNGGSQSILDARAVASRLAESKDVAAAFEAYESARRPDMAKLVLSNRTGGPERVIDLVEERAPDGFTDLDEVASHAEIEAIVKGYRKLAGFDQTQVNR
ncbi:MAG TPA: flavin-dependent oxidoreductase [Streptosporangiaceae bacterium]|nr:flavin-dependent oxidoreductase [Streptosporangiaceae bacterium]